MDREEAVATLDCDPSKLGPVRRRRGIALLMGAASLAATGRQEVQPQWVADGLRTLFRGKIPAGLLATVPPVRGAMDLSEIDPAVRLEKEERALAWIDASGTTVAAALCCSCKREFGIAVDENTRLGRVYFKMWTDVATDALRKNVDPRSWSTTLPRYFGASYQTDASECAVTDPPPANDTIDPGEPWNGTLFERFHWSVDGSCQQVLATNLLDVAATDKDGATPYRVCFQLRAPCNFELGCQPGTDVGLLQDVGWSEVEPDTPSGSSGLIGTKTLQFSDAGASAVVAWLDPALRSMVDAIADVGVCGGTPPGRTCHGCGGLPEWRDDVADSCQKLDNGGGLP